MAERALSGRLDRMVDTILARGDATAALADPELAPFAGLVVEMRHYPNPEFTARLKTRLKERTTMSTVAMTTPTTAPLTTTAREGFTTVTPFLRTRDDAVARFLKQVFGAVETSTTSLPNGAVHRELRVGSSMLMIGEGAAEDAVPVRPAAYHVYVEDVDGTFARALAAGGTSLGEPADRPYGERSGFIQDAAGNHWYIGRPFTGPAVPQGLQTVTPYLHPQGVPDYIEFLTRAFGAVEEARHLAPGGRVMHAQVRIGNAALELGEPDPAAPRPTTFYLYVDDADALYARAVAAGATPLTPPADQWYGDRVGSVQDPSGTLWYIARPAL